MNYTEEEMELYSIYMNYVREVVRQDESGHPKWVIKKMLDGKTLQKISDTTWSLQVIDGDNDHIYNVTFMSFDSWRRCEERDKRLNDILKKLDMFRNV
jgi:hypothetical protein